MKPWPKKREAIDSRITDTRDVELEVQAVDA